MTETQREFNPIHLFIRTDEKYDDVASRQHDIELTQKDVKNSLERMEKRIDFGVAVTGQKNADELSKQAVKIAQMDQTQNLHAQKLIDLERLIISNHDDLKRMLLPIYKGILAIFFSILCGGAVLWFIKKFGA